MYEETFELRMLKFGYDSIKYDCVINGAALLLYVFVWTGGAADRKTDRWKTAGWTKVSELQLQQPQPETVNTWHSLAVEEQTTHQIPGEDNSKKAQWIQMSLQTGFKNVRRGRRSPVPRQITS